MKNKRAIFDFNTLVSSILRADKHMAVQASRAINISLTLRNWLIGLYIAEFELRGADRANYGDNLLSELSKELRMHKISNAGRRQLYNYLAFYRVYPEIVRTVPAQIRHLLPRAIEGEKVRTLSAQLAVKSEKLLNTLSYSHIELLVGLDDDLKRAFYEIECIRGNWSVRELKRQVATLLFERTGLSKNKKKLIEATLKAAHKDVPAFTIRDPYVFEFLGLKPKEVVGESDLEDALLDKLQEFMLELGHGFCFEARQKRIVIGGEYLFVDVVFYHRILKCHVLIELKVDDFKHEYVGQLNTYVNYYRKNEMREGDNPPIGILLCTKKNHALVEYALAGMNNNLFVAKYQVALPSTQQIKQFLEAHLPTA